MQNILFLTDFSNNAYNALFYATQLLKSKVCAFYIINTFNELTPLRSKRIAKLGGKALLKQLGDESDEGLQSAFHKIVLDNNNPKHTFKTIAKQGALIETIIKVAEDKDIDLVVMGNKGKTGAIDIFMGGNTARTISKLKSCPILTVPKEIAFKIPKEIAFATDYKRSYSTALIEPLLFIASLFNASIRIMHINEEKDLDKTQEANKQTLRKYLESVKHTVHWMPRFTHKANIINNFIKDMDIDMLAMVYYDRSILEKLVQEPIIKDLSFYLDVPFLVIPGQK